MRETIALWIFLEEILPATTRRTSVIWRVDDTAALAHILKEGGLRGRRLLREAEDPDPPAFPSATLPFRLRSVGGEPPGGCGIALPVSAGLASRQQRVSSNLDLVGNTPDRPLRVAPVGAVGALYVLAGSGLTGSHRRLQREVELPSGLPLPSHSPHREGCEEAGGVEGDLSPRHSILGGPVGSPAFSCFQSWKSAASPSTTLSWSTSQRGNLLRL
jgi:hypothetical protein